MIQLLSSTVKISPEVLSQEVDGETVLLDMKGECYFGLDAIGTRIWQELKDGREPKSVVSVLLEEFDVDRETLEADLKRLIGELSEAGLVAVEPAG